MNRKGLRVRALDAKVAKETGIRPGDRIRRVNGHPVEDELDYRFHAAGEEGATVEVHGCGGGDCRKLRLSREDVFGVDFVPMRSRRCRNRCLFCFVDQMPDGLRKSLYVKDEDYRFSFLHGNYVTLASVKDEELDRICRLKLQPLYVSVHATEQRVRNLLLGRKTSRHVMDTLRVLAEGGITLHTQVVLCPGINDGSVLENTLRDLAGLYPAVASIAIVPVGLTRYRNRKGLWPIRGVQKKDAKELILKISYLQELFKVKYDEYLVFLSDEFYRLADHPFPPADAYGDFPQWENGVGMIPLFRHQWKRRRQRGSPRKTGRTPGFLIITGESAYPFVLPYVEWMRKASGAALRLVAVRNRLFGRSVNVTGLITGQDVISQVRPLLGDGSVLLVPDVMLCREGDCFLDGLSLQEMEDALTVPVEKFSPDPMGFERVVRKYTRGL
jgi:putative radical SAM enzyme (TIGR03279 family)